MNSIEVSRYTAAVPARQAEGGTSPQADHTGKEDSRISSRDEYVPKGDGNSPGLYRVEQDADGKRRIRFDAPKKAGEAESCTCSTDRVDREINRLREKQSVLKQQIVLKKDAPAERDRLEKQLAQVEKELSRKDTEGYRRQHADFS